MISQQTLKGKWHEISGKLKAKWGKLTDDDLRTFDGNIEQLMGRIQKRTGESREGIEEFLSRVGDEGASVLSSVREGIENTTHQAVEGARQGYEALQDGYGQAEDAVKEHPASAAAIAFGLGLLSGVGLVLLLHERPEQSRMSHARGTAEHLGRQILDGLAGMVPDSLKKASRG